MSIPSDERWIQTYQEKISEEKIIIYKKILKVNTKLKSIEILYIIICTE